MQRVVRVLIFSIVMIMVAGASAYGGINYIEYHERYGSGIRRQAPSKKEVFTQPKEDSSEGRSEAESRPKTKEPHK